MGWKTKLKNWTIEWRSSFLTATIVSIILGTVVAWVRNSVFNPEIFLLTLIDSMFLHLGTNVANDYFDPRTATMRSTRSLLDPSAAVAEQFNWNC